MEKIMLEQFMNLSKQIGELGARMEEGFKRQDEKNGTKIQRTR